MKGAPMSEEKTLIEAVLVFPMIENTVILARKVGKIGAGLWNGYGGGIEAGETAREAAVREAFEESHDENIEGSGIRILPENLIKVAIVNFHNTKSDDSTFTCRVHTYLVREWTGTPVSTEKEMINPTEFEVTSLPFDEMMLADRSIFPLIFSGKKILASAYYGPFQKTLLRPVETQEVSELPE